MYVLYLCIVCVYVCMYVCMFTLKHLAHPLPMLKYKEKKSNDQAQLKAIPLGTRFPMGRRVAKFAK